MSSLFFSIIIPSYNRANFINKTIHSVLEQTYSNFEVIIVDDGSTDNTEEVVLSIKDIRIKYYKKANGERGAARNFGIDKSTGDYVTFLDSDDLLYPNFLLNAKSSIEKFDFPPFLHLAYEIKNENGKIISKINNLKSDDKYQIIYGNPLSCIGALLKKEILEKYRFVENRNLSGSEDWEFWMRIIANYGIKACNNISAAMIQHDNRSVINVNEEKLKIRKELALYYAFQDPMVKSLYTSQINKIESFADSYIALHLIIAGELKKSLRYLFSSIKLYPFSIFTKRFFAILKHIILNILNNVRYNRYIF